MRGSDRCLVTLEGVALSLNASINRHEKFSHVGPFHHKACDKVEMPFKLRQCQWRKLARGPALALPFHATSIGFPSAKR